jgi:GGDEF domain-containing protein
VRGRARRPLPGAAGRLWSDLYRAGGNGVAPILAAAGRQRLPTQPRRHSRSQNSPRFVAAVAGKPFATTQDQLLDITVSIGCADLEPHDTAAHLIERVSGRLLVAKRDGRDRVC